MRRMMTEIRQVALLAAGCQPWNRSVVATKGRRFAYGATLAIYIYEMDTMTNNFFLHSIMAEHKKVITALDWHPKEADILASASADPCICVWNVAEHFIVAMLNSAPVIPALISWLPDKENRLIYMEHKGPLYCWKYLNTKGNLHAQNIYHMKEYALFNSKITSIAICKRAKSHLALGHADGTVSVYMKDKKPQRHITVQVSNNEIEKADCESNAITSLEWDPLSSNYILVASGSNYLYLLDTSIEPASVVSTYIAPSKAVSISSVAWLPEAPGSFISADVDVGILRIWNVSKASPLENIRLKQTGFLTFCVLPSKNSNRKNIGMSIENSSSALFAAKIICLFLDGGVGVYDLSQYSWDFCREMGHTETIFDCEFKPENCDLLATGSYDGTIKVWNINTMEAIDSSPGNISVIYSLSWAPGDLNTIAAGTSTNGIIIWNLTKRSITHKIDSHGKNTSVYCVSWNQKDSRKIASGGADKNCMVHHSDGSLMHTFKHPLPVYGCDWNPTNENILVTSCEDKLVRIYYVATTNATPLKILAGHTAKIFRVKWAPLREGVFCSGSDDCTVRVWDYSSGDCLCTLEGHSNNVRGLQWHPELANILLSGSWDFTIRVWDVSDGSCLNIVEDHGGDVYGLSCHLKRPFLLASTSRDSTVRLWSLFSLASIIYLKVLVYEPWDKIFGHSEQNNEFSSTAVLNGRASRQLKSAYKFQRKDHKIVIEMFSKLLCSSLSVTNLWDLVLVLEGKDINELSEIYRKGIIHHKHVLKFRTSEAQETELVKMARFGTGGIGAPAREECLRSAAKQYLSIGNLKRYCELQVELGEWKDALALAPGVSIEYWTSLANRWAEQLLTKSEEEAIPALMATGNGIQLLQFYRCRGQFQQAYCTAVALTEGVIPMKGRTIQEFKPSEDTKYNDINYIKEVLTEMAEWNFNRGSPINAACCYLAVDDVQSALLTLVRGNELELAVSLAIRFEEKGLAMQAAVTYLAWRCVNSRLWNLALDILDLCPGNDFIKAQICAYCELSLSERNKLHLKANLPPVDDCLSEATVAENNNVPILDVVKLYLLSMKPSVGLELGLHFLRESLSKIDWRIDAVWKMIQMLASTKLHVLHEACNETHCAELLVYSSYVGAVAAMCCKYYPVVEPLMQNAMDLMDKIQMYNLAVTKTFINHELAVWKLLQSGITKFVPEQQSIYENLINRIKEHKFVDIGATKVTGSNLPRHSDQHKCHLSGNTIQGPVFFLQSGKSVVSLNDAIMWAKVNPFCPLRDGQRIIPF